nr:uncharacterized protein LOC127336386 [Lolium perenne]
MAAPTPAARHELLPGLRPRCARAWPTLLAASSTTACASRVADDAGDELRPASPWLAPRRRPPPRHGSPRPGDLRPAPPLPRRPPPAPPRPAVARPRLCPPRHGSPRAGDLRPATARPRPATSASPAPATSARPASAPPRHGAPRRASSPWAAAWRAAWWPACATRRVMARARARAHPWPTRLRPCTLVPVPVRGRRGRPDGGAAPFLASSTAPSAAAPPFDAAGVA